MHPLDSARLKIKRANKHIRSLNVTISRTSAKPDVTLGRQGKLKLPNGIKGVRVEKASVYEFAIDPAIGLSWGLIVGDILGNLRAALDHIAWALAMKHATDQGVTLTEEEKRKVTFPLYITNSKNPFVGGLPKRAFDSLPPAAYSTVETFQPYNRTKWPELKYLGILDQLVNEDKHRIVTTVRRDVGFRFSGDDEFMRTRLNKPDKILFLLTDAVRNRLIANSGRSNLEPEVSFDVVLYVPLLWPNYFPVSEFSRIHNFIRDKVIPAFTGFF